jgi:two-component system cell cycle response regulator DivK
MSRILLVEDNEINRDMLSRRLRRRGFEVAIAIDGEEATQQVTSMLPDLILMDMSLPLKDGYVCTRELKQGATTREIPIIALTAHAMEGDRQRCLEAGCDDYETKPVDLSRLLCKIESLLQVPRQAMEDPGGRGRA